MRHVCVKVTGESGITPIKDVSSPGLGEVLLETVMPRYRELWRRAAEHRVNTSHDRHYKQHGFSTAKSDQVAPSQGRPQAVFTTGFRDSEVWPGEGSNRRASDIQWLALLAKSDVHEEKSCHCVSRC